jgi:hypothetical protein
LNVTKNNTGTSVQVDRLRQRAALALAYNQARQRIEDLCNGKQSDHINGALEQLARGQSSSPESVQWRDNLWQLITAKIKDTHAFFYTDPLRAEILAGVVRKIGELRNYYSHYSHHPTPLDFAELKLTAGFIEKLYDHACRGLCLVEPPALFDESERLSIEGAVFLVNLFLTRKQAFRLLGEVEGFRDTKRRRKRAAFVFFTVRERHARPETGDINHSRFYEIISYLALPVQLPKPPAETERAAGGSRNASRPQAGAGEPETVTPTRVNDKFVHYALRFLDDFQLFQNTTFWGYYQVRQTDSSYAPEKRSVPSKGFPASSKQEVVHAYARAEQTDQIEPERYFVYSYQDGNLRFAITLNGTTLQGVMSERELVNLIYALLKGKDGKGMEHYTFHWLRQYEECLTSFVQGAPIVKGKVEGAHLPASLHRALPAYKLSELPPIREQVATRLKALAGRMERQYALSQQKRLPLHIQVYEILTYVNAQLSQDRKFTRMDFRTYLTLLLEYHSNPSGFWDKLADRYQLPESCSGWQNLRKRWQLYQKVNRATVDWCRSELAKIDQMNEEQTKQLARKLKISLPETQASTAATARATLKFMALPRGFFKERYFREVPNVAAAIRAEDAGLRLEESYYQIDTSGMSSGERRKAEAIRLDWRTRDQLCLMIAKRYFSEAPEDVSVCALAEAPDTDIIGSCIIRYTDWRAKLKHRALASPEYIEKIIRANNLSGERDAQEIFDLFDRYHETRLDFIRHCLRFEHAVIAHNKPNPGSKGYVSFTEILDASHLGVNEREALKNARNDALHHDIPDAPLEYLFYGEKHIITTYLQQHQVPQTYGQGRGSGQDRHAKRGVKGRPKARHSQDRHGKHRDRHNPNKPPRREN